jgi:hypothetical protein
MIEPEQTIEVLSTRHQSPKEDYLHPILSNAPMIWGLLDLGFLARYVTFSLRSGRVPFYSDLLSASYTAQSFDGALPVAAASIGFILYISIPISGVLLIRSHRLALSLAYAQFPFRLIAVVPSLFFIPWLTRLIPSQVAVVTGIVLMIATELLKLWSLRQSRKL